MHRSRINSLFVKLQVAVGRGAKARVSSAHARFGVGDAQSLPLQTASVDAAVAGLAMNFVPEPASAVSEMARVVRPGGVVAVYVWDYGGRMDLMRSFWDAAVALDPKAHELNEGIRFPRAGPATP